MSKLQITINGEPKDIDPATSLDKLLEELSLKANHVAVEINMELIPRTKHAEYELQAGDELEIVTLAGGG